jgi:hypothetical protein
MHGILLDSETGDLKIDIRRDAGGKITGGLTVGEIDAQNQRLILIAGEGEFKEMPQKGVGLYGFMEDSTPENLVRKIRSQYFAEGLKIRKLTVQMPDKINIDAAYE